jgi:hypothetical protein
MGVMTNIYTILVAENEMKKTTLEIQMQTGGFA